jgi:branched-chain amino acid transport system ATP-binding protein
MLELRGINAGYGGATVLQDIDLVVPEGAVVALLGPNGAGKTTLLRVGSALMAPQAGSLLVDGEDVTGQPPERLVELGLCHVPEGRGMFRSLTVRENLRIFAGKKDPVGVERAVEAFPRLGERMNQIAGTMSGGEQQMLALARACVRRPRVVLLDEVSMGLAPKIVDEIFVFLERLAAEGCALLVVEQYVEKALAIADYVYILSRGALQFVGDPDELEGADVFAQYLGIDVAAGAHLASHHIER